MGGGGGYCRWIGQGGPLRRNGFWTKVNGVSQPYEDPGGKVVDRGNSKCKNSKAETSLYDGGAARQQVWLE